MTEAKNRLKFILTVHLVILSLVFISQAEATVNEQRDLLLASAPASDANSAENAGGDSASEENSSEDSPKHINLDLEVQVDPNKSVIAAKVLKKLTEKGVIDSKDVVFKADPPKRVEVKTSDNEGFNENVLVPIVAVIVIFGMPVFIVAVISVFNYRKQKLFHESVNKLIEQGMDIPSELYEHFEGSTKKTNHLRKGLVQVALGMALVISLSFISDVDVATLGLIPLFLGFANLLIFKLDSRNSPDSK